MANKNKILRINDKVTHYFKSTLMCTEAHYKKLKQAIPAEKLEPKVLKGRYKNYDNLAFASTKRIKANNENEQNLLHTHFYALIVDSKKQVKGKIFTNKEKMMARLNEWALKDNDLSIMMTSNPCLHGTQQENMIAKVIQIPFDFDFLFEEVEEKLNLFFTKIANTELGSILNKEMFKIVRSASGKMHAFLQIEEVMATKVFQASKGSRFQFRHWAQWLSRNLHDLIEKEVDLIGDRTVRGNLQHLMFIPNFACSAKNGNTPLIVKEATQAAKLESLCEYFTYNPVNEGMLSIKGTFTSKKKKLKTKAIIAKKAQVILSEAIDEKICVVRSDFDTAYLTLMQDASCRVKYLNSLTKKEKANKGTWGFVISFCVGHAFHWKQEAHMAQFLTELLPDKKKDIYDFLEFARRNTKYQYCDYKPKYFGKARKIRNEGKQLMNLTDQVSRIAGILYLTSRGFSQRQISDKIKVEQATISRYLTRLQKIGVFYTTGTTTQNQRKVFSNKYKDIVKMNLEDILSFVETDSEILDLCDQGKKARMLYFMRGVQMRLLESMNIKTTYRIINVFNKIYNIKNMSYMMKHLWDIYLSRGHNLGGNASLALGCTQEEIALAFNLHELITLKLTPDFIKLAGCI